MPAPESARAPGSDRAGLLRLQRRAGNRAVVARLAASGPGPWTGAIGDSAAARTRAGGRCRDPARRHQRRPDRQHRLLGAPDHPDDDRLRALDRRHPPGAQPVRHRHGREDGRQEGRLAGRLPVVVGHARSPGRHRQRCDHHRQGHHRRRRWLVGEWDDAGRDDRPREHRPPGAVGPDGQRPVRSADLRHIAATSARPRPRKAPAAPPSARRPRPSWRRRSTACPAR